MKEKIQNHLETYGKSYLILFIIFAVGVVLGITLLNNTNEIAKEQVKNYLTNSIENIDRKKISYFVLFKNSFLEKVQFIIFVSLISLSLIGKYGAIALILLKGFSIGYSISSIIFAYGAGKGTLIVLSLILLTEIMFIPTLFYVVITSIQMFNDFILQNYDTKARMIIRYVTKILGAILVVAVISLMETFISVNLFLIVEKII